MTALFPVADICDEEGEMSGSRARRCIVTGEVLPEGRLLRFAASPDGRVVPDIEAKLGGRGLWVRADKDAVATAAKKQLFSKAWKARKANRGSSPPSRLMPGFGVRQRPSTTSNPSRSCLTS